MSSSKSASFSMRFLRASAAAAANSAGISFSKTSFSEKVSAFMRTRSMQPWKSLSAPMGIWMGAALVPRYFSIWATTSEKSAPVRSILLTNAMRGTRYLSAWFQTVSLWGSTPPTAQNTATMPSITRSERSTSMVKSTWPGVSIRLIW